MAKLNFALFIAAGLVAAQSAGDLPTCAQTCLNDFITGSQIADCNRLDVACICANEDFINGIGCCLLADCDTAAQTQAIQYAATLCGGEGVTVPTEISCTTTTGAGSSATTTQDTSSATTTTTGSDTASATGASATETSATTTTTLSQNAGHTAAAGMGGIAAGVLAVAALV